VGYSTTNELEKLDRKDKAVVVFSPWRALHKSERPFGKSQFTYHAEENYCYRPKGHNLVYSTQKTREEQLACRIKDDMLCPQWRHFGMFTTVQREPHNSTIYRLA